MMDSCNLNGLPLDLLTTILSHLALDALLHTRFVCTMFLHGCRRVLRNATYLQHLPLPSLLQQTRNPSSQAFLTRIATAAGSIEAGLPMDIKRPDIMPFHEALKKRLPEAVLMALLDLTPAKKLLCLTEDMHLPLHIAHCHSPCV